MKTNYLTDLTSDSDPLLLINHRYAVRGEKPKLWKREWERQRERERERVKEREGDKEEEREIGRDQLYLHKVP